MIKIPQKIIHKYAEAIAENENDCLQFETEYLEGFISHLLGLTEDYNPYPPSGHERDSTYEDRRNYYWYSGFCDAWDMENDLGFDKNRIIDLSSCPNDYPEEEWKKGFDDALKKIFENPYSSTKARRCWNEGHRQGVYYNRVQALIDLMEESKMDDKKFNEEEASKIKPEQEKIPAPISATKLRVYRDPFEAAGMDYPKYVTCPICKKAKAEISARPYGYLARMPGFVCYTCNGCQASIFIEPTTLYLCHLGISSELNLVRAPKVDPNRYRNLDWGTGDE